MNTIALGPALAHFHNQFPCFMVVSRFRRVIIGIPFSIKAETFGDMARCQQ
jgi:hypothetical protein